MRLLFLALDDGWTARVRVFFNAARGLKARGHDVAFVCRDESPVLARLTDAGMTVVPVAPSAGTTGMAWTIRGVLRQSEFDALFVHSEKELLAATSGTRIGARRAAVVRRIPPFALVTGGRSARFAQRLAITGLLFSTDADRDAAESASDQLAAAVAPLSVDASAYDQIQSLGRKRLGAPDNARIVVCVHDGNSNERVLTALRTLALLAPRHNELHFVVVGGEQLDELRMHGAALGVSAMVTYLNGREDDLAVLRSADIGWVAANGDAAALAALDFMALGIPAIAERSQITEHYVADGIGGVLLPPADPATTAAAVAAFLSRDEQRAQMGRAGRARLEREFPFDAMLLGFEAAAGSANRKTFL